MNTARVAAIALTGFLMVGSTAFAKGAPPDCFKWNVPAPLAKEIQDGFQKQLDPNNKEILPGLPETEFPVREISRTGKAGDSVLVFLAYRERKWDVIDGKERVGQKPAAFYQVFHYDAGTKAISALVPPPSVSQSSRMWQIKPSIAKHCGKPEIKIKFQSCTECDDGSWYDHRLAMDPASKAWAFKK